MAALVGGFKVTKRLLVGFGLVVGMEQRGVDRRAPRQFGEALEQLDLVLAERNILRGDLDRTDIEFPPDRQQFLDLVHGRGGAGQQAAIGVAVDQAEIRR